MANKNKQVLNNSEPKFDIKFFLPILFIVGIVPLIFMGKLFTLSPDDIAYQFWTVDVHLDVFTYYKMVFFLAATAVLICMFVYLLLSKKLILKKSPFYIFLGIYTALVLLSAIMSPDAKIVFTGFINSYMGAFVWIGFAVLLFITYNMVTKEKEVALILKVFIFSSIILAIIGIPQYFGHDIFTNQSIINFYTPSGVSVNPDSLYYASSNSIYGTFGHSNYVGNYCVLILPVIVIMFLAEKKKGLKITYGIGIIANLFLLLGSQSRAGYVGMFAAAIVSLVVFRKYVFKHKKIFALLLAVAIIAAGAFNFLSHGAILNQIMSINPFKASPEQFRFEDVIVKDKTCTIVTNQSTIKLDFTNFIDLYDENGNKINFENPDGNVVITDPKYAGYTIALYSSDGTNLSSATVRYNGSYDINISFIDDKLYIKTGTHNFTADVPHPESIGFDKNESFASARGYIWSRTLPLLKNSILLGYGPDTFITKFPQNDIVGKLNGYQTSIMLVSKAHNMLLQMAVNSGVVSVIAYLIMIILYFKSCFVYMKLESFDKLSLLGIAISLSILGFLISGSFNDTLIYAGPIYWMFIGLGFAVNDMVKKNTNAVVK